MMMMSPSLEPTALYRTLPLSKTGSYWSYIISHEHPFHSWICSIDMKRFGYVCIHTSETSCSHITTTLVLHRAQDWYTFCTLLFYSIYICYIVNGSTSLVFRFVTAQSLKYAELGLLCCHFMGDDRLPCWLT